MGVLAGVSGLGTFRRNRIMTISDHAAEQEAINPAILELHLGSPHNGTALQGPDDAPALLLNGSTVADADDRFRCALRDLLSRHAYVDSGWYRAVYADVRDNGLDPAEHYILNGAAELRQPNP